MWLRIKGMWHEAEGDSLKAKCGLTAPKGSMPRIQFQPIIPCRACRRKVAKNTDGSSGEKGQKSQKPPPKPCVACGGTRAKFLKLCNKCAEAKGYRKCVTCSHPYLPTRKRQRTCGKCSTSGTSVWTVSGGLPSLGRRAR